MAEWYGKVKAQQCTDDAYCSREVDAELRRLEHLTLRAEAVWNFQLPPLPRPWWRLWGKDPEPELPAIVADLRNVG